MSIAEELEWILFGVVLLVLLLSAYLAKLVFAIATAGNLSFKGKRILASTEEWLSTPFVLLIRFLLVWAALALLTSLLKVDESIGTVLSTICEFFVMMSFIWFLYSASRLFNVITYEQLTEWNPDLRLAVNESVSTLATAVFIVVVIVTVDQFGTSGSWGVVKLLVGLNAVTGVIVVAFIPTLRDIVGGICVISDIPFHVGDVVELLGCTPAGTVDAIHLRTLDLRLADQSLLTVPNRRIQERTTIVRHTRKTRVIHVELSLHPETPAAKVRELLRLCKHYLFRELSVHDALHMTKDGAQQGIRVSGDFQGVRTDDGSNDLRNPKHTTEANEDELHITVQSPNSQVDHGSNGTMLGKNANNNNIAQSGHQHRITNNDGERDGRRTEDNVPSSTEQVPLSVKYKEAAKAHVSEVWKLSISVPVRFSKHSGLGMRGMMLEKVAESNVYWILTKCCDEIGVCALIPASRDI